MKKHHIDKSLNCASYEELSQRCQFQDWITARFGCLELPERNKLWDRFKAGKMVRGHSRPKVIKHLNQSIWKARP